VCNCLYGSERETATETVVEPARGGGGETGKVRRILGKAGVSDK
jgi:hypothetical protein